MSDEREHPSAFGRAGTDPGDETPIEGDEARDTGRDTGRDSGRDEESESPAASPEEGDGTISMLMRDIDDPLGTEEAQNRESADRAGREDFLRVLGQQQELQPLSAAGEPQPAVEDAPAPASTDAEPRRRKLNPQPRQVADNGLRPNGPESRAERGNVFSRMRQRAVQVARERLPSNAGLYAKRIIFGAALLGLAGFTVHQVQQRGADAVEYDRIIALKDGYGPVRDILRSPGYFARGGLAHEVGDDYEAGALMAERNLLESAFSSVTDPEARLAIIDAAVEAAIEQDDVEMLVLWLRRLGWIPGSENDKRTHEIVVKGYTRLVEDQRAKGNQEGIDLLEQTIEASRQAAEELEIGVVTIGWSPWLAEHLQHGLDDAQETPLGEGVSPEYRAGYLAAINEAVESFNLMSHVAFDETRQTAVHEFRIPKTP